MAEPGLLDQFDEETFWRECHRIVVRWPPLAGRLATYRTHFEREVGSDGRWVKVREWGETAPRSSL